MEGWLLDRIYTDLGTQVGDRVKYLYDTRTTLQDVPFVVLVRILSFIDKGDIFNVMCVCKRWLKASKERGFWEQLQRRMIQHLLRRMEFDYRLRLTPEFFREVMYHLDLFVFKEYGPKEYFGHLFQVHLGATKKQICWRDGSLWLTLETNISESQKVRFYIEFSCKGEQWLAWSTECLRCEPCHRNGLRTMRFIGGNVRGCVYTTKRIYSAGAFVKNYDNLLMWPNGDRFFGKTYQETDEPHGAGKWTFADGTTLTGDNVAFAGKPHGKGQPGETEYFAGEPVHKRARYISSS